jgi:hypothetical protein
LRRTACSPNAEDKKQITWSENANCSLYYSACLLLAVAVIAGRCRDVFLLRATFSFNGVNLYRESLQTYRRQTARADRDETGTIQ